MMIYKPSLTLFLCVIFLFSCSPESPKAYKQKEPPSDWFFKQRAFPYEDIDVNKLKEALRVKEQIAAVGSEAGFEEEWTFIGPTNVGGRITDLEMWPDDQNTILAGSASGGIFKSTDGGISWEAIFDEAASLAIGDIAIATDNPDIVYVGTGEANAGGGSLAYDGLGVYKSMDRGDTWQPAGLEGVGSIGKLVVDPKNSNRVFVAGMGRLFGNNSERGIFRTEDGGANWEQSLFVSDSTGGIDLAIHPENPDTLFAAMWQRTRKTNELIYAGPESGIYRSYDGGDNWELIDDHFPGLPVQKGRIGLAISPSTPSKIYAYIAASNGFTQGVYVSEDNGDSWMALPTAGITDVPYQWWFGKLYVDPIDEDQIYLASFNAHKLRVGESSWEEIFINAHVDQHAIYVHPLNTDDVYLGSDGGVYMSQNGGVSYTKSQALPNIQFYACEIDPNNTDRVFGGAQDNGTWVNDGDQADTWNSVLGGDGFRIAVEPWNSNVYYCEFQNGNVYRSMNGITTPISGNFPTGQRFNWNTPLTVDFKNPSRVYVGSQRVLKSEDRGNTFVAISPDLSDGPYSGNRTFGTIVCLESSSINADIIYAGTDDGNVWNSDDAGVSWNKVNPPMSVNRWTTSVLPDRMDEDVAYVTFSGFRYDTNDGHVYRTEDRGQSWEDITSNLPDIPINDIQVDFKDNELLYVATDVGVFYSENRGASWSVLGRGLPNVPVTDIDLTIDNKLTAATYGRSMYYYNTPGLVALDDLVTTQIKLYPNPSHDQIVLDLDLDLSGLAVAECEIYSIAGHLVHRAYINTNTIDISGLNSGSYILLLNQKDKKKPLKFKFVKM